VPAVGGGRNGKDGSNVTTACFGTAWMSKPGRRQERANPILTTECESQGLAGPGRWRRRRRRVEDLRMLTAEKTVISYSAT